MNYNLISPDGEGQNFRVKFQEPVVLPPDAKLSLNYAVFERNSVFDFTEDQVINLLVSGNTGSQNTFLSTDGGVGDIYPRLPIVQAPDNSAVQQFPTGSLNVGLDVEQQNLSIVIKKGHYTLENLNYEINKELLFKNFTNGAIPQSALTFFGVNDDGSLKEKIGNPNGKINLPHQILYIPDVPNEGGIQFGFNKVGHRNTQTFMSFSTTHLANATNVEANLPTTGNSFTPTANAVDYNSYALSKHRLLHFGNVNDIPLHNGTEIVEGGFNLEGLYAPQSSASNFMLSAITKQLNTDGAYTGKDFIGLYSIDYAGLENENQTNGVGLSSANNTTRKGRDESAGVHTPPTNEVIAGTNLQLDTGRSAGEKVPLCFFGVEFRNNSVFNKTEMNIFITAGCGQSWRHEAIKNPIEVYSALLDNLVGIDPHIGSGKKIIVSIHMVEDVDKNGKAIIKDVSSTNADRQVYFPLVFIGVEGGKDLMCVFDGRNHNLGGVMVNRRSGFGGSFLRQDTKPLLTDGLSYRGSDLPFAPILAGNNTSCGWESIFGLFYDAQNSGT